MTVALASMKRSPLSVHMPGVLALTLTVGVSASATADVPISYLADLDPIRRAVAGTPITIELHGDAACSAAIHSEMVAVEDVMLIERVRTVKIRGAGPTPRVARLQHVIAGAPSSPAYYARVVGGPIAPIGGACQAQSSEAAGGGAIPCASQVGTEVYFTGCNVNVRSGSGQTDSLPNGLGNLVIGYNEDGGGSAVHSGSHNLIIGPGHSYSSYVGMAVGLSHRLEGGYVSVSGGVGNTAAGIGGSVAGGSGNTAGRNIDNPGGPSVIAATVCGGDFNFASGDRSTIAGGIFNFAHSEGSLVAGGSDSDAFGEAAVVVGGYANRTEGGHATVTGGTNNVAGDATTEFASVSGGACNLATSLASPYVGFCADQMIGPDGAPSVSGGFGNIASGASASIAGGTGNSASGETSTVSGGNGRSATGTDDWRAGTLFENF
jgi:hypothetical protein